VSSDFYWNSLLYGMMLQDLFSGLGKSLFFAYFIGIIACYNGLHVTGGADGVGRATTSTVVEASITILDRRLLPDEAVPGDMSTAIRCQGVTKTFRDEGGAARDRPRRDGRRDARPSSAAAAAGRASS
jgi:hypothetical protein